MVITSIFDKFGKLSREQKIEELNKFGDYNKKPFDQPDIQKNLMVIAKDTKEDVSVREAALSILQFSSNPALYDFYFGLFTDPDCHPDLKTNLSLKLGGVVQKRKEVLDYFVKRLVAKDEPEGSKANIAFALGFSGFKAERAIVGALTKAYDDAPVQYSSVRRSCACALVNFLSDGAARKTVENALKDKDDDVRYGIANTLASKASCGRLDKRYLPWLQALAKDKVESVAKEAQSGIRNFQ
ncbi:MAG: HEAT repeat domain-containing protein [Candidatus Micrarchaeota archaeon]